MLNRLSKRACLVFGAFSISFVASLSAQEEIQFPSSVAGKIHRAKLVPVDEEGLYVTVGVVGADVSKGQCDGTPYKLLAQDPKSRMTFLRGPKGAKPVHFASGKGLKGGDVLKNLPGENGRTISSIVAGWGATFRDQQLPLTFLRVNHSENPLPGHPLRNDRGEVVAICHQATNDLGKGTFAIPADAVLRNLANFKKSNSIGHSWLGLHLDVRNTVAYVVGTRPDSPAQKFGFRKGDILLQIGELEVSGYSSAIDAFYYLIPGQAVDFKILRGQGVKSMKVTPASHPELSPEKK
ncbi:S1C family serine protease [Akkermansiaceae bacterium]|nr:S1C family serine protease [Akkermansiaceae bacterium]